MRGGVLVEPPAAAVRDLGFERATDLDGGFAAWKAAGLPVRALDERSIDPYVRPGLGPPEPIQTTRDEEAAWPSR